MWWGIRFDSTGQTVCNVVAMGLLALAYVDAIGRWRRDTRASHPIELLLLLWLSFGVDGWSVPVGAVLYLGVYRWVTPVRRGAAA